MKPSKTTRGRTIAIVGALFLLASLGGTSAGDSGSGATVRVEGDSAHGDTVRIRLVNSEKVTSTVTLTVRVLTENGPAEASATVDVSGGQRASVQLRFGSPVREILDCGAILDEGTPFS